MTDRTDAAQGGTEPERSTASEIEEQLRDLSEQAGGALGMPETTPIQEEGVPPTGPDIAGDDMFGGTTGVTSTGATTEDVDEGPGIK